MTAPENLSLLPADSSPHSGARFSVDRRYRYRLWRRWDLAKPRLCFIMLNPSTADEQKPDRTVSRCIAKAKRLGFGGLEVANLFAYRSTDPGALRHARDPVGEENDASIIAAANASRQIICAWGQDGKYRQRDNDVYWMLRGQGLELYCLRYSNGAPHHPLYLPENLDPVVLPARD